MEIKITLTVEQEDAVTIASLKQSYKSVKLARQGSLNKAEEDALLHAISTVLKFYGGDDGV